MLPLRLITTVIITVLIKEEKLTRRLYFTATSYLLAALLAAFAANPCVAYDQFCVQESHEICTCQSYGA